jgi:hypothetical protein
VSADLQVADTVEVGELRHRLLLGVALRDASTGGTPLGPVVATLESLGAYRLEVRLDAHGAERHALRYSGPVASRLRAAVKAAADTHVVVRIESPSRMHVARRLRFALALDGDAPSFDPPSVNVRTAWLWPGAAHPMPATGTIVRGRVLEGPDAGHGIAVAWARVFATIPGDHETFDAGATVVGSAHVDDRGEYTLAIGAAAFAGAELARTADVRLWAFRRPLAGPPNPADPLEGLVAEEAGLDGINDVLRGAGVPAGYTQSVHRKVTLRAGDVRSGADPILLFP